MVLLEIDPSSLSLVKLELDAPRSMNVNRKARWFAPAQSMEVKAREIEVRRLRRRIESVKHQQRTRLKIRSNLTASPFFEQLTKALVLPRPYHTLNVNFPLSFVNSKLTFSRRGLRSQYLDPPPDDAVNSSVRMCPYPVAGRETMLRLMPAFMPALDGGGDK
jgi:hypothetical protein